jgi:hypothetical protein
MIKMTHNKSFELTNLSVTPFAEQKSRRPALAAQLNRVCRAWHKTREVKVLLPGNRRAEG